MDPIFVIIRAGVPPKETGQLPIWIYIDGPFLARLNGPSSGGLYGP